MNEQQNEIPTPSTDFSNASFKTNSYNPENIPQISNQLLNPNYFLIEDSQGLYLIPDNKEISLKKHFITHEKPEKYLQSPKGHFLAIYYNCFLYLLEINAENTYSFLQTEDSSNKRFKISHLIEMKFIQNELILKTKDEFLSINLNNYEFENKGHYSTKAPVSSLICNFITVNEAVFVENLVYEIILSFFKFTNYDLLTEKETLQKDKLIDDSLLKSIDLQYNFLKDQLILHSGPNMFRKNKSVFLHASSSGFLINISLEKGIITFFSNKTNSTKSINLNADFDALELIESPCKNVFLLLLNQPLSKLVKTARGVQKVYLLNCQAQTMAKVYSIYGPVYLAKWNHKGDKFMLLSGVAPSHAIVYNKNNTIDYLLGKLYANSAFWSSDDSFLAIGGFGQLENNILI